MGSGRNDLLEMPAWMYIAMGGFFLVFFLLPLGMTGGAFSELTSICLLGGVLPSAIVVLFGAYRWNAERNLRALAAMAQTYRRLRVDEFARRAGWTRLVTERRLAEAVDLGYVKGFVDRSTDEFVVQEAVGKQVYVAKCPTCGAQVDRWVLPEERFQCPYCGAGVLVPLGAPRPQP